MVMFLSRNWLCSNYSAKPSLVFWIILHEVLKRGSHAQQGLQYTCLVCFLLLMQGQQN